MVGPPFRKPFNLRAVIIFSELGFVNPVNRDMIDAIVIHGFHGSHLNYLGFLCHSLYENVYVERKDDVYDGWRDMNEPKWPFWECATGNPNAGRNLHGYSLKNKVVIGINVNDKLYWAYQLITRGPVKRMGKTKNLTMERFERRPFKFVLNSDNMAEMSKNMQRLQKIKDPVKKRAQLVDILREYFFGYVGIPGKLDGILNGAPKYDFEIDITDFHHDDILYNKLTHIFDSLFNKSFDKELFEKIQADFKTKFLYDPVSCRNEKYAINDAFDLGQILPRR